MSRAPVPIHESYDMYCKLATHSWGSKVWVCHKQNLQRLKPDLLAPQLPKSVLAQRRSLFLLLEVAFRADRSSSSSWMGSLRILEKRLRCSGETACTLVQGGAW